MWTRSLLGVLAVILLASCVGDPQVSVSDGDGAGSDPAGSWVLVGSQPTIDVPDDARVTLDIGAEGDAWQVGGTSACNSYGGRVVTEGSTWHAEGYGGTEMACEEPRMSAEQAYLDALHSIDTWARPSTDELVLTGSHVELRFEALPSAPTRDLTATRWVLDGLVVGTGDDASVSSTAPGADEATLRLGREGDVDASTGCRNFSGEWTASGDEILLTTFGVRDDSPHVSADGTTTCDRDAVRQEEQVLSVLGDGFRAEIDGQRLTLSSRDGLGLAYRAAQE